MNKAKIGYQRISNIIQSDKQLATSNAISDVLKADVLNCLKNFFTLYENTAQVNLIVNSKDDIDICFTVKASRIKEFFCNNY